MVMCFSLKWFDRKKWGFKYRKKWLMSKNCSWNILMREHPWNFKVTSQREDWIHCCLKLNPTKDDLNIYFKDFNEEADFPNHLMRYKRGIKSRFEHQTSSEDVGRSSQNARRNSLDMMGMSWEYASKRMQWEYSLCVWKWWKNPNSWPAVEWSTHEGPMFRPKSFVGFKDFTVMNWFFTTQHMGCNIP